MTDTAALRALIAGATPLSWSWHTDSSGNVSLSAPHGGRTIVMDFARRGMQRGQPRFAISGDDQPRGRRGGILVDADKLPGGIADHPDARLIVAAVNALPGLCDELDALRAELANANAAIDANWVQHQRVVKAEGDAARYRAQRDELRDAATWLRTNWGRRNPFRKHSEEWVNWDSAESEQFDIADAAIDAARTLPKEGDSAIPD